MASIPVHLNSSYCCWSCCACDTTKDEKRKPPNHLDQPKTRSHAPFSSSSSSSSSDFPSFPLLSCGEVARSLNDGIPDEDEENEEEDEVETKNKEKKGKGKEKKKPDPDEPDHQTEEGKIDEQSPLHLRIQNQRYRIQIKINENGSSSSASSFSSSLSSFYTRLFHSLLSPPNLCCLASRAHLQADRYLFQGDEQVLIEAKVLATEAKIPIDSNSTRMGAGGGDEREGGEQRSEGLKGSISSFPIPDELFVHLLSFLPLSCISSLSRSSHLLYRLCRDESFWSNLFLSTFISEEEVTKDEEKEGGKELSKNAKKKLKQKMKKQAAKAVVAGADDEKGASGSAGSVIIPSLSSFSSSVLLTIDLHPIGPVENESSGTVGEEGEEIDKAAITKAVLGRLGVSSPETDTDASSSSVSSSVPSSSSSSPPSSTTTTATSSSAPSLIGHHQLNVAAVDATNNTSSTPPSKLDEVDLPVLRVQSPWMTMFRHAMRLTQLPFFDHDLMYLPAPRSALSTASSAVASSWSSSSSSSSLPSLSFPPSSLLSSPPPLSFPLSLLDSPLFSPSLSPISVVYLHSQTHHPWILRGISDPIIMASFHEHFIATHNWMTKKGIDQVHHKVRERRGRQGGKWIVKQEEPVEVEGWEQKVGLRLVVREREMNQHQHQIQRLSPTSASSCMSIMASIVLSDGREENQQNRNLSEHQLVGQFLISSVGSGSGSGFGSDRKAGTKDEGGNQGRLGDEKVILGGWGREYELFAMENGKEEIFYLVDSLMFDTIPVHPQLGYTLYSLQPLPLTVSDNGSSTSMVPAAPLRMPSAAANGGTGKPKKKNRK